VTAALGVLLIDVLEGLIIAMVASLLLVIYRSSRPSAAVLGEIPDAPGAYGSVALNPGATENPGVLVVRFDAPVYYANASSNVQAIKALVAGAASPVRTVVFDLGEQHQFDVTSLELFAQLVEWLGSRSIEVFLVAVHQDLRADAERGGLLELIGEAHVLRTIPEALAQRKQPPSIG